VKKTEKTPAAPAAPIAVRLAQAYVQIPVELITDPMLFPLDIAVVADLVSYSRGGVGAVWCCNATLCHDLRCSRATLCRSLQRLESTGWIAREPAPTTRRGNLIRLQWSLPRPGYAPKKLAPGGASPVRRGRLTSETGAPHQRGADLDSKKPDSKKLDSRLTADENPDLLGPEDLATWTAIAEGGDRVHAQLARVVIAKHDAAQKKGAAGTLAKVPPAAESKDTVLDRSDPITDKTKKSRRVVPTEHKGHYE
jgi:hypothetical protein